MKYCVTLEKGKENCFAEIHWTDLNGWEILKDEPFNNQLLESELTDLIIDDLICVDGVIQVDLEKYHSTRSSRQEEELRARRNLLLTGWDKYTSNAAFGVYNITESDREMMIAWYGELLDMNEDAINYPPSIIKHLIGEKEN